MGGLVMDVIRPRERYERIDVEEGDHLVVVEGSDNVFRSEHR